MLGGKCFKISERRFIDTPLKEEDFQKVSPRMFIEYNPDVEPEPLYFREGILNSFPEEKVRARFLNKFYECLMAGNMPHKTRKRTVLFCGPMDSPRDPKPLMTSQLSQKSWHRYLPNSGLQNKGEEKKEKELVFFRKLTFLKSKLGRCFLLLSFQEHLIQSSLNANILGRL